MHNKEKYYTFYNYIINFFKENSISFFDNLKKQLGHLKENS